MKTYFLILCFVFMSFIVKAQEDFKCFTRIDTNYIGVNVDSLYYQICNGTTQVWENSYWDHYRDLNMYIPDMDTTKPLHVTPIKTVRLNINIIQKDDGTGNFDNSYNTRKRMRQIITSVNNRYSSFGPSDAIAWVTELPNYDSRIRFSIGDTINERLYFYQNTDWWGDTVSDNIMTYIHSNYPEREEAVNVFIYGNPNNSRNGGSATYPNNMNFFSNQSINMFYWNSLSGDGAKANLLAHELGHILSLGHTYEDIWVSYTCDQNYRDFLKDVFLVTLPNGTNCPHICKYNADADSVNGDRITNNLMGGNKNSKYISPMQAGNMHRAMSMYSVRKYVECEKSNVPLVITGEEVWDFNMKLYRDLIIENGAKVTLTCRLVMHSDAKIIIKPGGRLIVDGATISNDIYDKNFWQGIEVWGNSSAHQYMVNNNYLQGYLEMKNGATIENAKCAVQLWRPNYISTTGGIIHATDAVFRNNATSLIALNYNNYNPHNGHESDYNGYLRDCEFVVDGNYLGNETFYTHVELGYNRGIDFTGCDFSVSSSANGVSANNAGITAYSAGFGVKSSCMDPNTYPCPTNSIKGCTFTGFNTGILSINEGNNTNTLSIKDAVFTNNHTGIHALNIGYAAIVGNEFNIGCGTDCTYGVYIDGATSFCIEENLFKPAYNIKCTRYGVGVFNSPSINDIYLNTFNNLTYGNLSYGVNYNVNGGLTYSCNENSGNKIDFCVLKDNGFGMPKPIQGSSTSPAGNTFGGSQYHIYNDGDLLMDYHYNSSATGQTPNSSKLYRVNAYPTTYSNSCASHYGGGGVLKSPEEKTALAEIYKTSQDNHERYLAAGDIIRSNLNDSVANPTELRQWLANMNEIASDRMIVASYIHEGDFTNAFALANTLPNKYNLQGDELSDHNDYMTLLNLYRALYNSNRTVRELTESEKETVANIAENGHGASKLMATGIIMETSDRTAVSYICPALSREDGDKNEDTFGNKDIDYVDELFVGLSPIPASTWVSVDYKLPANYAKATMTIMSSYGAKIMDVELLGDKGTTTVDLSDLSNGVYSYIVRCGDKILTGKLVVTK